MGSGTRFNSRIYTNSYSRKSIEAIPFLQQGNSFAKLSKPQYSYITYNTLANNGASAGGRAGKWYIQNKYAISFIPPSY